jgi:hypothetical protein
MTGPGDGAAAGGRGRLRASHADREQVIAMLKAAFVQGRLAKDELDERAGQAFASRTYAELAAVTADLPAGLADTRPPRRPARARGRARILLPGRVLALATVLYAATWPLVLLLPRDSEGEPRGALALVALTTLVYLIVLVTAGGNMLDSWQVKRSGRLPPPRPRQGGRAPQGEQHSGPGDDLMLCQAARMPVPVARAGAGRRPAVSDHAPGPPPRGPARHSMTTASSW